MTNLLWFIAGLILLIDGSTIFVKSAVQLAGRLRISKSILAGSVIAIGTSLPELSVTIAALIDNDPALALGNIIGSNISNIFLILGIALAAGSIKSVKGLRAVGNILIIVTIIFAFMVGPGIKPPYGVALLVLSAFLIFRYSRGGQVVEDEDEDSSMSSYGHWFLVVMGLAGLIALVYGAGQLTRQASGLALALGMSEFVIGIIMLAIGTSLPELAATIAALRQRESGVAVNTLISSNLFNITLIGGVGGLSGQLVYRLDWATGLMFISSAVIAYIVAAVKFRKIGGRIFGVGLLMAYVIYLAYAAMLG